MRALAFLACAAAAWVVVTTVHALVAESYAMPVLDHWATVQDLRMLREEGLSLAHLFRQHNEHRLVFPRLLFLLDYELGRGRGTSLRWASALAQMAHAALLFGLVLRARPGLRPSQRVVLAAVLLVCAFAATQMHNLIDPFQVQFPLVYLAATAAFAAAALRPGPRWAALAMGAAVVSTYTMANGVLVWPLLGLLAWRLRRPGLGAAVGLAAAAALAAYLWSYEAPPRHTSVVQMLARPGRVVAYALCYLGSGFSLPGSPASIPIAVAGGALVTAAFLALGWRALRLRSIATPAEVVLVMVGLFAVGTAALTSVGRLGLTLDQALSSRYSTPALLLLAATFGLFLARPVPRLRVAAGGAAALLLAAVLAQQHAQLRLLRGWRQGLDHAETSLLAGVFDASAVRGYVFDHDLKYVFDEGLSVLRENRLALFADERHAWLDADIAALPRAAPGECAGAFDAMEPIFETGWGFRARGWAWDAGAGRPVRDVVLADENGRIVGVCAGGHDEQGEARGGPGSAWRGHGRGTSATRAVTAYALTAGRGLCRLGELPFAHPALAPVSALSGRAVVERALVLGGAWAEVRGPGDGAALASRGKGAVAFGPWTPARAAAVGLPLRVGPVPWPISVYLCDVGTGTMLGGLAPAASPAAWSVWRFTVPDFLVGRTLGILVEDRGLRAGEWVEVGLPRWLE
jgi:hypothetical protein